MTNNLDEFDAELDNVGDVEEPKSGGNLASTIKEAWRTQPLFKLGAIMGGVVVAVIVALNISTAPPPDNSRFIKAPGLDEVPGGKSSQYFIEQNKQAANQRAEQALQEGGSAIPTPVGQNMDIGEVSNDGKKKDPLQEFRAETERLKQELKQEQKQNTQQIKQIQQQVQKQPFDDSLAQAMMAQMQQLMKSWSPKSIAVVNVSSEKEAAATGTTGSRSVGATSRSGRAGYSAASAASSQQGSAGAGATAGKSLLITAGTINYGQLLIEANSDIKGPIVAQIVSGPLSGGRAVGQFTVENDYLVMKFNLVTLKDKEYSANILAINPNTTLGGMATEVDKRYFDRVVLPAAASFVSSFGQKMGEGDTSTTVAGSTVLTNSAKTGLKEGIYSGIGQMGQTMGQFMQSEANKIKPLVRVAAGTPMGLLFLTSVKEGSANTGSMGAYGNMTPAYGMQQGNRSSGNARAGVPSSYNSGAGSYQQPATGLYNR